jgi:MFS family permease
VRALYLVLSTLVVVAVPAVAAFLVPGTFSGESRWPLLAITIGSSFSVIGPLVLGWSLLWWPGDPRSEDSRKALTRVGLLAGASTLIGIVSLVTAFLLADVDAWVPIGAVVAVLVFACIAVPSAEAVRRRSPVELFEHGLPESHSLERAQRALRRVPLWFVLGVVLGLGLAGSLTLLLDEGEKLSPLIPAVAAIAGGAFASSFSLMATLFRMNAMLREAIGNRVSLAEKLRKIVIKGEPDDLNEEERERAVRWAQTMALWIRVQLTESLLAYLALVMVQVGNIRDSSLFGPWFAIGLALLFAVLSAVTVPLMLRQRKRALAYVERNRDLVTAE